jgi:hypothetical protein
VSLHADGSENPLVAHLRKEVADRDVQIERLHEQLLGAARAGQRADDRTGQLEAQLATLQDNYQDLLSIAARAGADAHSVLDRVPESPRP